MARDTIYRGEMQKNEKSKEIIFWASKKIKKSNVSKVRRVLRTPLVFACQRQVPQVIYKNINQARCRRIIGVFWRHFSVHTKLIFSKVAICSAQMKLG